MELLDLVSQDDIVMGSMIRSEIYHYQFKNFRTVNAFIVNDRRQLWIPKRQKTKSLNPGMLDASIGGHVKSGESYDEALVREAKEETNLDLRKTPWEKIGKLSPYQDNVTSFMQIYLIYHNTSPNFNTMDFMDFDWTTISEVIQKIKSGMPAKPDLIILLNYLNNLSKDSL